MFLLVWFASFPPFLATIYILAPEYGVGGLCTYMQCIYNIFFFLFLIYAVLLLEFYTRRFFLRVIYTRVSLQMYPPVSVESYCFIK